MSILGSWAPDWADSALDTAGKVASSGVDLVNDGAKTIGKGLDLIPVIGPLYSALWTHVTSPLDVSNKIVQGVPIDRVALETLQQQVQVARTVAPYAQMVMQLVPGVGPIASGAISAGIALANGQTIDQALLEGVKGALPGGPLAKAAFDAGQSALAGESAQTIGLKAAGAIGQAAGIQVPPAASKALSAGLGIAESLRSGQPIPQALAQEAIRQLPETEQMKAATLLAQDNGAALSDLLLDNARGAIVSKLGGTALSRSAKSKELKEALNVGMALGTGQYFQKAFQREIRENPGNLSYLEVMGNEAARVNAEIAAAAALQAQKPKTGGKAGDIFRKLNALSAPKVPAGLAKAATKAMGPEFPWGDVNWQQMQGFAGESDFVTNPEALRGFRIGIGLMMHNITRHQFTAIRNTLTPDGKLGFDAATALHVGRVISEVPEGLDMKARAAYLMTKGLSKGVLPPEHKAEVLKSITQDESAREGATVAIDELKVYRQT